MNKLKPGYYLNLCLVLVVLQLNVFSSFKMRVLLFLLIFEFALTSVIEDLVPIININVTRVENDKFRAKVPKNCCVINFLQAFKVMVYMPKQLKKKIKCYNAQNANSFIDKNLTEDNGGYSITIQKATADMATDWQCRLYYSSPIHTHKFKMNVRGQKLGTWYINNNNIKIYRANYTTTDYDEYTFHSYIAGEITTFEYMMPRTFSSLQILYQNQVTDEQFVVDNKDAVLHLRLTKEYNNNYLDCSITETQANGNTISSTLRVFFDMNTALDIPRFMINEMVLSPVSESNAEYNPNNLNGTFVYDFHNNENVTIRTLTGNISSLRCRNEKYPHETVKDININTTLKKENNNLILSCTMKPVKEHQHQNDIVMTLKLKYVEASNFYLSGLSWANVLAKYKESNGYTVIKYSYRGGRLVLTCYGLDNGIEWKFQTTEFISESVSNGYKKEIANFFKTKWFEMKSNYNKSTIKCYEEFKPRAEVQLIRDGPQLLQDIPKTDILKYFDTADNNTQQQQQFDKNDNNNNDISSVALNTHIEDGHGDDDDDDDDDDGETIDSKILSEDSVSIKTELNEEEKNIEPKTDEESFLKNTFVICATVGIAIVVITIIVCVIMKRFKHKRAEETNSSNINYENLPKHNDGPMPIPQQWQSEDDDVTYATPEVGNSIDNLYAKPLSKNLRTPIYAEAFDYANKSEADYVNTGRFAKRKLNEGKDDSNYSEVYQSNKQANFNSNIKYANVDHINETYAQVDPNTIRDCANMVSLKENQYGNLNVTAHSSNHDSETAYAEIK